MEAHKELSVFIATVRRRWFASVVLRTAGVAAMGGTVPLALALAVDRFTQPQGQALVFLASGSLALSLVVAGWILYRIQRRPDDRRVARFIEERAALEPGVDPLDDAVVTAVAVGSNPAGRPALHALLVSAANRKLSALTPSVIVPLSVLRRSALIAVLGLLIYSVVTWRAIPAMVAAGESARFVGGFPVLAMSLGPAPKLRSDRT